MKKLWSNEKKKRCNWQRRHSHSIVTFLHKRKKKKNEEKKSKLINGKLGFFLALHDSPFSQLFILFSLFYRKARWIARSRITKVHENDEKSSQKSFKQRVWKEIVWLSHESLWLVVYIYFTFSNARPNYGVLFWIKKVQNLFFISSTIIVVLAKALSLWY